MTHGLEILPLNKTSQSMLEQAHGSMAKMVQGQSKQTANVVPVATLGWRSMESHLDYIKLLFLWRLLLLSMCNIYKQVVMIRLCYHMYEAGGCHLGPLWDIFKVFQKYSMDSMIDAAMKSGEMMSRGVFKGLARKQVDKYELSQFRITCLLYKSLSLFNICVTKIAIARVPHTQ